MSVQEDVYSLQLGGSVLVGGNIVFSGQIKAADGADYPPGSALITDDGSVVTCAGPFVALTGLSASSISVTGSLTSNTMSVASNLAVPLANITNCNVAETLTASAITVQTLGVSGNSLHTGHVQVNGNMGAMGTLSVWGMCTHNAESAFMGDVTLDSGSSLEVTGDTLLNGGLQVGGNSSLTGTVTVDGVGGLVVSSAPTNLGGVLSVTGMSTFEGGISTTSLTVIDDMIVQSNALFNGSKLEVVAPSFLDGSVTVQGTNSMNLESGNLRVGGYMSVVGASALGGGVSVSGDMSLLNNLSLRGRFSGNTASGTSTTGLGTVLLGSFGERFTGDVYVNFTGTNVDNTLVVSINYSRSNSGDSHGMRSISVKSSGGMASKTAIVNKLVFTDLADYTKTHYVYGTMAFSTSVTVTVSAVEYSPTSSGSGFSPSVVNQATISGTAVQSSVSTTEGITHNCMTTMFSPLAFNIAVSAVTGVPLGERVRLFGTGSLSTDYAFGIAGSTLWYEVPSSAVHSFCTNAVEIMKISSSGVQMFASGVETLRANSTGTYVAGDMVLSNGGSLVLNPLASTTVQGGGRGINLWTQSGTQYAIYMSSTYNFAGYTPACTLGSVSSFCTRFRMGTAAGFGWIWESGNTTGNGGDYACMSLDSVGGNLNTLGNITAGGSLSVTGNSTIGGNLTLGGELNVTGDSTMSGNIAMAAYKNVSMAGGAVEWSSSSTYLSSPGTVGGTRIKLYGAIGSYALTDFSIGIDGSQFWFNCHPSAGYYFNWGGDSYAYFDTSGILHASTIGCAAIDTIGRGDIITTGSYTGALGYNLGIAIIARSSFMIVTLNVCGYVYTGTGVDYIDITPALFANSTTTTHTVSPAFDGSYHTHSEYYTTGSATMRFGVTKGTTYYVGLRVNFSTNDSTAFFVSSGTVIHQG
jgi:hypothetical protein